MRAPPGQHDDPAAGSYRVSACSPQHKGSRVIAGKARLVLLALAAIFVVPATANAATPDRDERIVFASTRFPAMNQELYSVAGNGTGLVRLTWSETTEQHPDWSPDGSQIAFGSFAEGRQSIHVMNHDGSGERRLSPGGYEGDDTEPTWSPDGSQIAFASTRPYNGAWHIWVMNADGSGLRQLTGGFSTSPAWSPDGTRIAYVDAGGGISVVEVEGGNPDRVTQPHAEVTDEHPAWSPDGTKLAFARRQTFESDPQLYVVDADGSNERQLTTTGGASRFPSWSPDGLEIVFTHMNRLSLIRDDGTGMRPLLGEPWGNDLTPDWGTSTLVPGGEVPGAPTIQIFSPEAQLYPAGYPLDAFYLCESETSYVVSCEGDVPVGSRVDTSAGEHTFTVRATDAQGRTSSATVTYEALDFWAPAVNVRTPADGAEYEVGEEVEVDYECLDEPGGSGVALCDGELQDGQPLDTSQAGTFTVHFWAIDHANNVNQLSVTYRVADRTPPTISVFSPQEGSVFVVGQVFSPTFSCSDDAVSCRGDGVDTSSVGSKTFTVTARDASGNVATATHSYRVVYSFSGFSSPLAPYAGFATLKAGDKVPAKFSLGGDWGLGVVVASRWTRISCSGTPLGDSSPANAGGKLSYHGGRYQLLVDTTVSWAGSCRQLAVTLDDGTTKLANISFG
jgi:Tol biopolymer transport system component